MDSCKDVDVLSTVDAYMSSVLGQFHLEDICPPDPLQQYEEECMRTLSLPLTNVDNFDVDMDNFDDNGLLDVVDGLVGLDIGGVVENATNIKEQRPRSANAFKYSFGNVFDANWYIEFLQPSVHEQTYFLSSRDCFGVF